MWQGCHCIYPHPRPPKISCNHQGLYHSSTTNYIPTINSGNRYNTATMGLPETMRAVVLKGDFHVRPPFPPSSHPIPSS